jgi:WD40 repeat protein
VLFRSTGKELPAVTYTAAFDGKMYEPKIAAGAGRMFAVHGTFGICDLGTGKQIPVKGDNGPPGSLRTAILMPGGKTAATVFGTQLTSAPPRDIRLVLWDMVSGTSKARTTETFADPTFLAASPSGNRIFACCSDGALKVWDGATLKPVLTIPDVFTKVTGKVISSADGSVFAALKADLKGSPPNSIKVWRLPTKP